MGVGLRREDLAASNHTQERKTSDMKLKLRLFLIVVALNLATSLASAGPLNGHAGSMPALYDGVLFTINLSQLSDNSAAALLDHNNSINFIYESDDGLPGGQPFVAVLDAIQGDGFNPLWVEVQIHFTAGHTPRQLGSDNEISDAFENGEITLEFTDEVYRCAVTGPK